MTASLLILSAVSATVVAPSPASAANRIVVHVRDDGFSQLNIEATEDDELIFQLDGGATLDHSIAWEAGWFEFEFSRPNRMWVRYGPLKHGPTIRFYDRKRLPGRGPHPPGPFSGSLTVSKANATPPPPAPSPTSTTVTSEPPTTVTTAPTTTTSAPTSVRPQFVPEPPSTTTTVAAPAPPTTTTHAGTAPPAPNGKKDDKDRDKEKLKSKPAPVDTSTTTAPAPSDTAWIDFILAPEALTPTPTPLPDQPAGSEDEVAIDAARAASLLDRPASESDDNTVLLLVLAAVAGVLLSGGFWAWFTRASRYDPA